MYSKIGKSTTLQTFGVKTIETKTIYGQLQEILGVKIEPAPDDWDRLYNVDFYIKIENHYIGLQIKPMSGVSHIPQIYKERRIQKTTHEKFHAKYGSKVFYIISKKLGKTKIIHNKEIITEIREEIERLKKK